MTYEVKVHACSQCKQVDRLNIGQTSVGCQRCGNYAVCISTYSAVAVWNLQNGKNNE